MREILIKRGGFTQPGCSFFGDLVNESYEGGRGRGGVCFLLKSEIRRVTGRARRVVDSFLSRRFLSVFTRGEGGALGTFALLNSLQSITR